MKHNRSVWLTVIVFPPLLIICSVLATFLHEIGHGLAAELQGGEFLSVYVMPGIQVWPEFGQAYPEDWNNRIACMFYEYGSNWQAGGWETGFVSLMGSGANLILATLALAALWAFEPKGLGKLILAAESLMYFDIVFYTFLPQIGLRHLFFIGGFSPEPLEGALEMGIPRETFLLVISGVGLIYTIALIAILRGQSRPSAA